MTTTTDPNLVDLSVLFEPLDIGTVTSRNRILLSAHDVGYCDNGLISDRYIGYLGARARGGSGLIVTCSQKVHPSGGRTGDPQAWREENVPRYRILSDTLHEHGTLAFSQLNHIGQQDMGSQDIDEWHVPLAPSAIPSPLVGKIPKEMDDDDIAMVVDAFAVSASRSQEGGMDGVELNGAHGYLICQFLSPLTNRRQDRYGGSTENRTRFPLEVAAAIRERCGRDFPLGIRISFDEYVGPNGIEPGEADGILEALRASRLFDYLFVSGVNYHTLHKLFPPRWPRPAGTWCPTPRARESWSTATSRSSSPAGSRQFRPRLRSSPPAAPTWWRWSGRRWPIPTWSGRRRRAGWTRFAAAWEPTRDVRNDPCSACGRCARSTRTWAASSCGAT